MSVTWRRDVENMPRGREFLVVVQRFDDKATHHVAKWVGAGESVLIVGGAFAFDRGPVIAWAEFNPFQDG